ncbi:MAG: xanthine dehydrogenase family protein subunit M [Desulfobacteraceae bacterium]|nr:xanthine dehydrogenase family protein subunit M [Desulfobacteraceae bacterium]
MTLSKFDYYGPKTVAEAVGLLGEIGEGAKVMAGGTDVLVRIRHRMLKPRAVVGLKRIEGLNGISCGPKRGLSVGATALLADVAAHRGIRRLYPGIAEAALGTANVQVRNMATLAGNLCNASPAADNAPTLLALNAELTIQGPGGERKRPLEGFFKGPGVTDLAPEEVVTAIFVPPPAERSGTAYLHLSARGKHDCTAVGVGVMLAMAGRKCRDARIFISACGPTPLRAPQAEQMLIGQVPTDKRMAEAGVRASGEALPICDIRASADYRCRVLGVLTRRALQAARDRAAKKG